MHKFFFHSLNKLFFVLFLLQAGIGCKTFTAHKAGISVGQVTQDDVISSNLKQANSLYEVGEVQAAISILDHLVKTQNYSPAMDHVYESLITWQMEISQEQEARSLASFFIRNYPQSESVKKITDIFDKKDSLPKEVFDEVLKEDSEGQYLDNDTLNNELLNFKEDVTIPNDGLAKIAIVLPLTGTFAHYGNKALKAMSIGLGAQLAHKSDVSYFNKDNISFLLIDSKGDKDHIAKIVDELLANHKISLIVGDILPDISVVLSEKAANGDIPLLSLARRSLKKEDFDGSFVFNVTFEKQMDKLASIAFVGEKKNFAILHPQNSYGINLSKLFETIAVKKGGKLIGIQSYPAEETTFSVPIKKLVGLDNLPARAEFQECRNNVDQNLSKHLKEKWISDCRSHIKPIVDFDFLFIPDQKIVFIAPALIHADILTSSNEQMVNTYKRGMGIEDPKIVTILGTNTWHDDDLVKRLGSQIDGAFFVDSYNFALNEELKNFYESFLKFNLGKPSDVEVFAHDAIILSKQLYNESSIKKALTNFNGKVGLLQTISFDEKQELLAPLYQFELKNGLITAL